MTFKKGPQHLPNEEDVAGLPVVILVREQDVPRVIGEHGPAVLALDACNPRQPKHDSKRALHGTSTAISETDEDARKLCNLPPVCLFFSFHSPSRTHGHAPTHWHTNTFMQAQSNEQMMKYAGASLLGYPHIIHTNSSYRPLDGISRTTWVTDRKDMLWLHVRYKKDNIPLGLPVVPEE